MITKETAAQIWECYREMAAAEKLLTDIAKERKDSRHDDYQPRLSDAFGNKRLLQLGIPSGDSCHTLYGVSTDLAESVIRAHIANKKAELTNANEKARIELQETSP